MKNYQPPLDDIHFCLDEFADLLGLTTLPKFAELTPDLAASILVEAGRLATAELAPLNVPGDRQGSRLENGVVVTPEGFRAAYAKFVAGGWNAVPFDPAYGGQGLPWSLATALQEMWGSANLSFSLCPLLTQGAVELLLAHGTADQRHTYLPKLISGTWTGTMNLTEPQAGSDVGAIRCRALPDGERYLITGQKIFITYGDHDLAENIIHLVLARTPDAPPGSRGVSLFMVPKRLINAAGTPGPANDLRVVSLEHKLGIHASPTCVMAYGDNGGAIGYLVGEENRGIEYMFTMMNNARLSVGLQGLSIAERSYQMARDYALTRIQGRPIGATSGETPIIGHPDVRRMLMTMRAQVEAIRAFAYFAAGALDRARHHPDATARSESQRLVDLLIPVVKGWSTEVGCESASLAIQVHGGLGFIEETGVAQLYRDARIAPIYEGTNGIQAIDLVGRKLMRDKGAAARDFITGIRASNYDLAAARHEDLSAIRAALAEAATALARSTDWLIETHGANPALALAGASPYLRLFGTVAGGWLMAMAALAAARRLAEGAEEQAFLTAKIVTARFYADNILPQADGLTVQILRGGPPVLALPADSF
ncbi:MAG: 3-(methylsulfanyl)propanoyl-CoA dehydrogenase [Rhodospirillaceae bacterium]|nr:3-(methylsulfanyl)propanoyl-CoA dehydrogenase [Rhodospirillaceae bacterium]